jgi:hypothetical protein
VKIKELLPILACALMTAPFSAQASDCAQIYREAYVAVYTEGQTGLQDAADIYLIYFDAKNGLVEARQEAAKLLADLDTPPDSEWTLIQELTRQIDSGELCVGPRAKSWPEILTALRPYSP